MDERAELKPCPFCGNVSPFTYISAFTAVLRCPCGVEVSNGSATVLYKREEVPAALRHAIYEATALEIQKQDGSTAKHPNHGYVGVNVIEAFRYGGALAKWNRRIAALLSEQAAPVDERAELLLRNLLARIHRDGGHYTAEHGLEKSCADADIRIAALLSEQAAPVSDPTPKHMVWRTAPQRIWLNVFGLEEDYEEGFPDNHEGITWCADEVGDLDTPYVRADIAEQRIRTAIAEAVAAETERCARIAESQSRKDASLDGMSFGIACGQIAAAIRAKEDK